MTKLSGDESGAPTQKPPLPQQIILSEAKARFDAAANAEIGLVERLVWFWSNHFCVSADKDAAMAGAYEREAIRPHVLGRFTDLLQAAESHPAMLVYLDNVLSMGADSIAGINQDKGLNENLARETLELHTLGVRSGYSQADVTNFAKVLTGWTGCVPRNRSMAANSSSCDVSMSRAIRSFSASITPTAASIRAAPYSPIWRAIRRRRSTLEKSSLGTLSLTTRRRRLRPNWPRPFSTPMAI
jgi:hypothetical protein